MTGVEITNKIEFALQTKGYHRYGSLEPEEINMVVDTAIDEFISNIEEEMKGKGIEDSIPLLEQIKNLKVVSEELVIDSGLSIVGGVAYTLPTSIRTRLIGKTTSTQNSVEVKGVLRILDEEERDILLDDTYHKTTAKSPVATMSSSHLIIYTDKFTITKVYLSYLKNFTKFDATSTTEYTLPNKTMEKIIKKAIVELATILEQRDSKIKNMSNLKSLNK